MGYDASKVSDKELLNFIKFVPQETVDEILEIWDRLPDPDVKLTESIRKKALQDIQELRKIIDDMLRRYCESNPCLNVKRKW